MYAVLLSLLIKSSFALQFDKGMITLERLDDYNECHRVDRYSGRYCHDALRRWVEKYPNDLFKAGQLTRQRMNSFVAIEFFHKAFKSVPANDCSDDQLLVAVKSALDLPYGSKVSEKAKDIAFNYCYDVFKSEMIRLVKIKSNPRKHLCKELLKRNVLEGRSKDKCRKVKL